MSDRSFLKRPQHTAHIRHISLHGLVAATVMLSPTKQNPIPSRQTSTAPRPSPTSPRQHEIKPIIQAGGGEATSEVPMSNLATSKVLHDHMKILYDTIRGPDPLLSRDLLGKWMTATQGQTVDMSKHKEKFKLEEFLEFVWYNEGFSPLNKRPNGCQDLTKPISNYFISSSHNTYLEGNQLSSKSSPDAYKNVLKRGCRCIEIDVWNGEPRDDKEKHILSGTAAASVFEEAKDKFKSAKEMFSTHIRVPSINTAQNEGGLSTTVEGMAITDTPLSEKHPSPRSSRHNSHSSSNSSKHEPLVLHGWTLTKAVGFREVCQAIRESAFLTTDLPLIVSLEVHADMDQQEVMVEIMKEEWEGLLIDEAHPTCDPKERLPRLEELRNKILVKVKKATLTGADLSTTPSSNTLSPTPTHDPESGQSGSEDDRASKSKQKKKAKICEALGKLGIYTHSESFRGFDKEEASYPPHVFSIEESRIMELHTKQQADLFKHNLKYFMRAYPAGIRIDSSNPDPSIFWRKGVQMVALNWQSWDEGMMINEGMFAGEHGWVLKPPAYRTPDPSVVTALEIRRMTLDFKITIFAGQHIPLPPDEDDERSFHPYVKCELHVDKHDDHTASASDLNGRTKEGRYKKETPHSKGDHPDFGIKGVTLSFIGIPNVVEELSFLRLKIEDDETMGRDQLAAWACIRLDRLQQGYRLINLIDAEGVETDGLLLVKIEKSLR